MQTFDEDLEAKAESFLIKCLSKEDHETFDDLPTNILQEIKGFQSRQVTTYILEYFTPHQTCIFANVHLAACHIREINHRRSIKLWSCNRFG